VLVITPRFPIPPLGACEKDRYEGLLQMKRLGFDVRVIGKVFDFQSRKDIDDFSSRHEIPVTILPYESQKKRNRLEQALFYFKRLINPLYWDGAAYEYAHKDTREAVLGILDRWKPDVVWFDYTYLWPLYGIFRARGIPIITRSINFEATHFLEEDGRTLKNYLKFLPKLLSEIFTIRKSGVLFSITPHEERVYRRFGAKNVTTLPLRGVPLCIRERHNIRDTATLHVFFMGSTYNVHHNRHALLFILKEIIPRVERQAKGAFLFHIIGSKVPDAFAEYFISDAVSYDGIKMGEELETFLGTMDIALVPSLMGAGMQQKIFEPLARGIPTVVSPRGLAGYPFACGEHLLCAKTADAFADGLLAMRDTALRRKLSANSIRLSKKLFSQKRLDGIITDAVRTLT